MKKLQLVRGFRDFYGPEVEIFRRIREICHQIAQQFTFQEVVGPILEYREIFQRSLGETSDIISKQLFEIEDMVLRPEGTASVVRFCGNRGIMRERLYYIGPFFRRDRPQRGRFRQFWQAGFEFIGGASIAAEFDMFLIIKAILNKLDLDFYVMINTIGNSDDRKRYEDVLQKYFLNNFDQLSPSSKERFEKGAFLRILDSKDDDEILGNVPNIFDFINETSKNKMNAITNFLKENDISYKINNKLVRGLDYYNDLVFEIFATNENLAIGGGGRYDVLFEQFGLQKTSAIGFALGIDRLMLCAPVKDTVQKNIYGIVIPKSSSLLNEYVKTVQHLQSINQQFMTLEEDLKSALSMANKQRLTHVIFWKENLAIIKDMASGKESNYD